MSYKKPSYEELEALVAEMEKVIKAVKSHEIDSVSGNGKISIVRSLEKVLQSELILKDAERKLRLSLQGSGMSFWEWSPQSGEIILEDSWTKFLGYEPGEIIFNFTWWERSIHPDSKPVFQKALAEYLEGKKTRFELEFEISTKAGEWKWIWAAGECAEYDDQRAPVKFFGTLRDITEQKRLQKRLEEQEAVILQSRKMESIATLAGGIAHDFNNMLGVITGNISYALSNLTQDEELFEILSNVQEGAKQAKYLTNQLLTFAKGGNPIKKSTDLKTLISESAIFVTRGSISRCELEFDDELWPIEVDTGQLCQVISNIVINAMQSMPEGGIIKIQTKNKPFDSVMVPDLPPKRYIQIAITDTGTGIPENHLPRIFDPFFTTKHKGSGLGLAVSYSIIKQHDGHISVESKLGAGTTFLIFLPASEKPLVRIEKKEVSKHFGQGRILIMDDQEPILKMLKMMLTNMGYETVLATDGTQAIDIYREAYQSGNLFDLVILDLTIPGGMGGAKTIPELLKINPKVKAVVSSGYSNDPIMSSYQDYGFCGVVPKPYTKSQLAELLKRIFEKPD